MPWRRGLFTHKCCAGCSGSPAFIASTRGADSTWQYMMPQEPVDAEACPQGYGSGTFSAVDSVQNIVAVVGTAHVRGIITELQKLSKQIVAVKQ